MGKVMEVGDSIWLSWELSRAQSMGPAGVWDEGSLWRKG